MKSMGIFIKHEKTHFHRHPDTGEVMKVTREINGKPVGEPTDMGMKSSKQLEREYYEKHPEEKHKGLKMVGRGLKRIDKAVVNYNTSGNPWRKGSRPSRNNRNPFGTTFDFGMTPMKNPVKKRTGPKYVIWSGKEYPIAGTGKKKKKKKKRRSDDFGFGGYDMLDNSGFFK